MNRPELKITDVKDENLISILARNLESSPMFHFSLASKELFHSNFLKWISSLRSDDTYNLGETILKSIFPFNGEDFKVEREWNHFDLVAGIGDFTKKDKFQPLLVVENKLKSVPTLEQIKSYTKKLKNFERKPCCYLLTMMETFPDRKGIENEGWKIVTYDDVYDKLMARLTDVKDAYTKNIIIDYCGFISNLKALCDEFKLDVNDKFLIHEDKLRFLQKLRLDDLIYKHRMSAFAATLRHKLPKAQIRQGYGQKGAWVEIWFPEILTVDNASGKEENPSCVIAVQGDSYSHGIYPCKASKKLDNTFDGFLAADLTEFRERLIKANDSLFVKMGKTVSLYCKYKSKHDSEYRYQNVKISSETTVSQLIEQIVKDYNNISTAKSLVTAMGNVDE